MGRILASFPRLVADAFSPHPVETISRPFSAALCPQVSKPTFGGTGVSACAVRRNHLSVLASPSDVGQGNNRASGLNTHAPIQTGRAKTFAKNGSLFTTNRVWGTSSNFHGFSRSLSPVTPRSHFFCAQPCTDF